MNRQPSPTRTTFETVVLYGLLFTVFFWLLTRFVEAVYTLGLLGVEIPPEVASVALLFSPLALVAFPQLLAGRNARRTALVCLAGALICQAAAPLLPTRARMLVAGLGVGLFLVGLPALLRLRAAGPTMGGGLILAGLVSLGLRVMNSGSGPLGGTLALGINGAVVVVALALLFRLPQVEEAEATETADAPAAGAGGFWRVAGLYLGMFCALVLLYYGFLTPVVISRWTGVSFVWAHGLTFGSLALFGGLWLGWPRFRALLAPRVLLVWSVLFALALALALLPFQVEFPTDPAAYPFYAPRPGLPAYAGLFVALVLHPIIYSGFARLVGALVRERPAPRHLAGAAALAALFLLVMIFAQVLTTVYDYMPVVGPLFRDRFWQVIYLPAAGLALALLLVRPSARGSAPELPRIDPRWLGLALAGVFVAGLLPALPKAVPEATQDGGTLRVMTYNIQQGYDTRGENAYNDLLQTIRAQNPDILGLQESDTARIANANGDVVRYLANGLGMYSYYGPDTTTGTFGIALLSRYPIENPRTFFMYSEGEQTAAILAEVRADGETYTILVTHLGNGGPLIQQQQVLVEIAMQDNVIAMGDFNFRPSAEQYRQTTALFSDAWETAAQQIPPQAGFDAAQRIDHVFLSPALRAVRAEYLPEGISDHPGLVVDVER